MSSSCPWVQSLLTWCLRQTMFILFPHSVTQLNSFQNGSCQVPIGRNHHTLILYFLWQFNNIVFFTFLFLNSSLHLSSSFIKARHHLWLYPLEDVTSFFLPPRLLKFFFDLPAPFQVNFSCLLTGDQSVFIQLYTKWNLLCVSLLGLFHPLNFCSVEK